jgi:hypothetical protein
VCRASGLMSAAPLLLIEALPAAAGKNGRSHKGPILTCCFFARV